MRTKREQIISATIDANRLDCDFIAKALRFYGAQHTDQGLDSKVARIKADRLASEFDDPKFSHRLTD